MATPKITRGISSDGSVSILLEPAIDLSTLTVDLAKTEYINAMSLVKAHLTAAESLEVGSGGRASEAATAAAYLGYAVELRTVKKFVL